MTRRPSGPAGSFGFRNAIAFQRDELGFLSALARDHGDLAFSRMLGEDFYFFTHPEDIEAILIHHNKDVKKDSFTRDLRRALGDGLVTSEGQTWRRHRKLASSAFTPKRIRTYGDAMVAVTAKGISTWRDHAVIDLHAEMSRVTMDVVGKVLFGADVDSEAAIVGESMEAINEFFSNSPEAFLRLPMWLPTPRNRRFTHAVARINQVLYSIISERRKARDAGNGEPGDNLLSALLAAQDDGDGPDSAAAGRPAAPPLSDEELRDECVTLFLAGHETTALALVHVLYLLSKNPEIETRFHRELDQVLGGRTPSSADVKALDYTDRILKESMRLYPPVWAMGREIVNDFEIRGYRLPPGVQAIFSQWVVHRDPRWYPDPEVFDPDRWAPELVKTRPRMAYFPFGAGPRVCIGNHFAMMEAVLLLATIGQRFRLELLPDQKLEFRPSVTLRPKRAIQMRLVPRKAAAASPHGNVSAGAA